MTHFHSNNLARRSSFRLSMRPCQHLPLPLLCKSLAVLLMACPLTWATEEDLIGVEESWELVLRDPDPASASPQISSAFSPIRDDDIFYAILSLNHRQLGDDFAAGGLQLQLWYGEHLIGQRTSDKTEILAKPGEKVTWTQSISVNGEGLMTFSIKNGSSDTWGSFGAPLSLQAWTNLRNLNSYQPSNSVKSSGMMFGANRVQSHRLTNVRVIFQSGESKNLRIP